MPQPGVDDRRGLLGDPPEDVRVTVLAGPRGPTLKQRAAAHRLVISARVVACVAVIAVVMASLAAIILWGGAGRPVRSAARSESPAAAPANGVASAGFPPGCVSLGLALHDPRFGRPSFDRTIPCLGQLEALGGQTTQWPRDGRAVRGRQWIAP